MVFIVSTFDECGVEEYKTLLRSIRQQSKGVDIRLVGLYGEISTQSQKELAELVDDLRCFDTFETHEYFQSNYGKSLYHPLGKFAKLFFVREYIEAEAKPTDRVLFLDPDVVVQRPLKEFLKQVVPGVVLFGHEMQLIHHAHRDNLRLKVAERFDEIEGWKSTYITEINTGVNLSIAEDFLKLMADFEDFVKASEYLKVLDSIHDDVKWHDQDFFRYFYRKTLRLDIGCLDIGLVFTTTLGASKCLYFDVHTETYKTNWDAIPYVVHFAGGTMGKVARLSLKERLQPDPVPLPGAQPHTSTPAISPSSGRAATSQVIEVPLDDCSDGFPYSRHAVLYTMGSQQLVERWLRKLPKHAQVLFIVPNELRDEGRLLSEKYAQVIRKVAYVGHLVTGVNKQLQDTLSQLPGMTSVVVPYVGKSVELQFVPDNYMPELLPQYELFRGLWQYGFRRFAIESFAGTKYLKMPHILDEFKNKHKGKRCFVVGNGPSLNDLDMELLKDEITLGSNRCYLGYEKWGFDFTYWGVLDRLQVEEYGVEYMDNVPAHTPKFFPFEYATLMDCENACPVPFSFDGSKPYKFSGSPDQLHLGFTVVHMMLQIAVVMGFKEIYLVGCDHRYNLKLDEGKKEALGTKGAQVWTAQDAAKPTHFTDKYTADTGAAKKFITPKPERMDEAFDVARAWCDAHGVEVYNATPDSGLKAFPMVDYTDLF